VLARLLAAALVVVAILAPGAHATEPFAPLVASATFAPNAQMVVSWVPGEEPADSFNVYGFTDGGGMVLLKQGVTDLSVTVPSGFGSYAVSGVSQGNESGPVPAISPECEVFIHYDPPGAGYWCPEQRKVAPPPDVRAPTWPLI